jgi:hypothetical protein
MTEIKAIAATTRVTITPNPPIRHPWTLCGMIIPQNAHRISKAEGGVGWRFFGDFSLWRVTTSRS